MKPRSVRKEPSSGFNHTFLVIFAFLGAFFFRGVASAAITRTFPSAGTASLAGFLTAAVLGGSAGAVLDGFYGARRARAKVAHPEEPWLWDEQWAAGRIAYSNLKGAIGLGVFAAVTVFFTYAVLIVLFRQFSFGLLVVFLMFGFPALLMSVITVALVRQHFAFGNSALVLETRPGVIGGEFAGVIEVRMPNADRSLEFRVSIACIGPGRRGDLWKKELVVTAEGWRRRGDLVEVPFRFELPNDLPTKRVRYSVRVSANAKPLDYEANFPVPIFRTFTS